MEIKDGTGSPIPEEEKLAWFNTLDLEIEMTTDPHWKAVLVRHKELAEVDYGIKI